MNNFKTCSGHKLSVWRNTLLWKMELSISSELYIKLKIYTVLFYITSARRQQRLFNTGNKACIRNFTCRLEFQEFGFNLFLVHILYSKYNSLDFISFGLWFHNRMCSTLIHWSYIYFISRYYKRISKQSTKFLNISSRLDFAICLN